MKSHILEGGISLCYLLLLLFSYFTAIGCLTGGSRGMEEKNLLLPLCWCPICKLVVTVFITVQCTAGPTWAHGIHIGTLTSVRRKDDKG
jgi:hypothetical protein